MEYKYVLENQKKEGFIFRIYQESDLSQSPVSFSSHYWSWQTAQEAAESEIKRLKGEALPVKLEPKEYAELLSKAMKWDKYKSQIIISTCVVLGSLIAFIVMYLFNFQKLTH